MQATLKIADLEIPGHFRSPSAKQHPHDKASGEYPEDRLQHVAPLYQRLLQIAEASVFPARVEALAVRPALPPDYHVLSQNTA